VVLVARLGAWVHRIAAIRGVGIAKAVNLSRCKSTTYRSYPKIMHIFLRRVLRMSLKVLPLNHGNEQNITDAQQGNEGCMDKLPLR
jgi:hypothetical protein